MKKIIFPLAVLMSVFVLAACGGVSEDEFVAALNCNEGMNEYAVEGTPIQFCYDPAWGEPSVHDAGGAGALTGITGSNYFVSFLNSPAGPEVWYESADYSGAAPSIISFSDLNVYAPDDAIFTNVKEQLKVNYNFSDADLNVRKADIGGVRAARVHLKGMNKTGGISEDTLSYYIPNAWEGYNMTVTADYSMAEELDNFVYDMIL